MRSGEATRWRGLLFPSPVCCHAHTTLCCTDSGLTGTITLAFITWARRLMKRRTFLYPARRHLFCFNAPVSQRKMEYQKECVIGAHTAQILIKSPAACTEKHDRGCQRCWEKHLSNEVETMDARDGGVRCMFCLAGMGREDLVRLARKGTVERYGNNAFDASRRQC